MKGQLLSSDFILGAVIFLIVIGFVVSFWFYVDFQIKSNEEKKETESRIIRVSDILIKSPGSPENWNGTNVSSVGFYADRGRLNLSKIINFLDLGYQEAKHKLGLQGYEFYLYFNGLNGSAVNYGGRELSFGMNCTETSSEIYKVERVVILQDSSSFLSAMNLILWR